MARPMTKAALLDWTRRERAAWELLLAEVGEARMEEPGAMGKWTFRDLLVHLTAWQQYELTFLERGLGSEIPDPPWPAELDPDDDQDRINQFVYEVSRDQSVAEILRTARQAWDRLEEGLSELPEAAVTEPGRFPWAEGEALGPRLVRRSTAHFHEDHESDLRVWLAERQSIEQMEGTR